MNIKTHTPLILTILLIIIIILVLFWPRECKCICVPEVQNHYIYVPKEVKVTEIKEISKAPEVADLPEEVIFEAPVELRYGFTKDDIYLMTVLLCGSGATSGDGEYDIDFGNQDNHEQISLVLSVVMNRVMSDKFPNTVAEVIWAPKQFSPMSRWTHNLPTVNPESYAIVEAWCKAYDANDLSIMSIPENHLYFTGNGVINKSRGGF